VVEVTPRCHKSATSILYSENLDSKLQIYAVKGGTAKIVLYRSYKFMPPKAVLRQTVSTIPISSL